MPGMVLGAKCKKMNIPAYFTILQDIVTLHPYSGNPRPESIRCLGEIIPFH
jgi:hypothetical protein